MSSPYQDQNILACLLSYGVRWDKAQEYKQLILNNVYSVEQCILLAILNNEIAQYEYTPSNTYNWKGLIKMEKLYYVIVINEKTNKKQYLTTNPFTHKECMTIISKQSSYPTTRFTIEEAT